MWLLSTFATGMPVGVVRMCILCYYNNPKTPEAEEACRKQLVGNAIDYTPWVANSGGNTKRAYIVCGTSPWTALISKG